jgi:hypothetical protein
MSVKNHGTVTQLISLSGAQSIVCQIETFHHAFVWNAWPCDKNGSDWLIQTGSGFAKSAGRHGIEKICSTNQIARDHFSTNENAWTCHGTSVPRGFHSHTKSSLFSG